MAREPQSGRYPVNIQRRLERILRLFVHLHSASRTATAEKLCKELEISRRTLFRDMKLLRNVGVQISYDLRSNTYRIKSIVLK